MKLFARGRGTSEEPGSLKTQLGERLPQILADRIQLQQVLLNLIWNAVEAMATGGVRELEIESQLGDSERARPVRDSGPGLDPTASAKLSDHFIRQKQTAWAWA